MINTATVTRTAGSALKCFAKGLSTYGPTIAMGIYTASAVVNLGESIINLAKNNRVKPSAAEANTTVEAAQALAAKE